MIKKIVIAFIVIVLASVNLLALTGCPKETEGFEGGFIRGADDPLIDGIIIAVKSDKSVFDIDDVTFDLYYGTTFPEFPIELDERYEPVCVAVYYQIRGGGGKVLFDDYKNSGRYQIMKEISLEDFYGGDYAVTKKYESKIFFGNYRYTFTHSEKFTVPSSYLIEPEFNFYFYISVIYFDKELSKYFFSIHEYFDFDKTRGASGVSYKLLEDGKVRLF